MTLDPWIEKQRDKYVVRWRDEFGETQTDKGFRYSTRNEAKPRRDIVRTQLLNKSYGKADMSRGAEACFGNYIVERESGVSAARVHCLRESFNLFMRFSKVKFMAEIERKTLLDFKAELYRQKLSEHTIHMYLGAIAVWLKWAKLNDWIKDNPYSEIGAPIPKPVDRYFTNAEVLKLEACIRNVEFRCMFRFGWLVGLRPNEILAMESEHLIFHEKENVWTLNISPQNSKTGTGRMVAVPPLVIALLPKREGRLFPEWSRKRMGRHMKWALEAAELPILVVRKNRNKRDIMVRRIFYWTRHTYGRRYLEKGGSLRVLSILMGHASIKITADTYGHLENSFVIDQAHAINAIVGNVETALLEEPCRANAGQTGQNGDVSCLSVTHSEVGGINKPLEVIDGDVEKLSGPIAQSVRASGS